MHRGASHAVEVRKNRGSTEAPFFSRAQPLNVSDRLTSFSDVSSPLPEFVIRRPRKDFRKTCERLSHFRTSPLIRGHDMPPDDGNPERPLENYRDRLRDRARRTFDRRLRGFVDVSDLVQITISRAYAKRNQFQGNTESKCVAWLYRILARVILDALRKLRRQGGNPQSLDQNPDDPSARPNVEPVSDGTSPSQKCVKEEEGSQILKAMEELPEDQRTAVRLRHMEGFTVAEVAERMGRSLEAVASLLYRGRKSLREKMGQDTSDGER